MALQKSLDELTDASNELNAENDTVNEAIKHVEDRINEAEPGIEFWSGIELYRGPGWAGGKVGVHSHELGYGPWQEGWRLLYRINAATNEDLLVRNDHNENVWDLGDGAPLVEAPRHVRIAALPHLEDFVGAFACHVRHHVDTLRETPAQLL